MGIKFEVAPDYRTPECAHGQPQGCHRCCPYCDLDNHRCGACGEPMKHLGCLGAQLGTCGDCRDYYFRDEEPS